MDRYEQLLASLTQALTGLQSKDISGTPDAQLPFGPGGFFSNFGLDSTVINLSMAPKGIDRLIPAVGTVELNPVFAYITGIESDGSEEADGVCDDAPGGVIETCHQTAAFGRLTRGSKEIEVNTIMQILNNRLSTDMKLLNAMITPQHPLLSTQMSGSQSNLKSVINTQLLIIATGFQQWLCQKTWTGNPANNSMGGGYKEFPGLDILISTGKVDAFTGVACEALDPDIKAFAFNNVRDDDPDIVEYLSMMFMYLTHVASRTNLDPVEWVIVMRPDLWFEITGVWPCRYLSNRCNLSNDNITAVVINDNNNVAMRDEMRNGMYLWINGLKVPVITDDGIYEQSNQNNGNLLPGQFASDIYILPIRAKGMPVLYWEYLDYSQAMSETAFLQGKEFWSTDGGRYLWAMQQKVYCFKFQGKIEPRLILRTPQLAGRITNVLYTPLQHLREPFEGDPYWKKGGNESYNTPPHYYNDWDRKEQT
jgi:hypothetical protein